MSLNQFNKKIIEATGDADFDKMLSGITSMVPKKSPVDTERHRHMQDMAQHISSVRPNYQGNRSGRINNPQDIIDIDSEIIARLPKSVHSANMTDIEDIISNIMDPILTQKILSLTDEGQADLVELVADSLYDKYGSVYDDDEPDQDIMEWIMRFNNLDKK